MEKKITATNTGYTSCGFQSNLQVHRSLARAVTVDNEVATNSRTLHTLNVSGNSFMKVKIIITSPKRRIYRNLRNGFLVLLIMITGILRSNKFNNQSDRLGYLVLIAYLMLIVIVIFLYYLSRRKQVVGSMIMNSEEILIEISHRKLVYTIKDLPAFTIKKLFLNKNISFGGLGPNYDNWLFIMNGKDIQEYQFILDSMYADKQLGELIESWEELPGFRFERGNK